MKSFSIFKKKEQYKKVCSNISFSTNNKNNQSKLDKESLKKLIDGYFSRLDEYEVID